MKNNFKIIFLIMLMVLSIVNFSSIGSSLFPVSHSALIHNLCQQDYDTEIAKMCCRNIQACISCETLSDISIIFYLERGMRKYQVSHSLIFYEDALKKAKTDDEESCAAGFLMHSVDLVSHNILVPYSIEKTGLTNVMIHPFSEEKIENYVKKNYPEAEKILQDALDVAPQYVPFLARVLQPNPEYQNIDVAKLSVGFLQQIRTSRTGYDVGFAGYGWETIKSLPKIIYVVLAIIVALCIFLMWLIIAKTQLKFINIFTLGLLFLIVLLIFIAFIATALGQIWSVFTMVISPISNLVPTPSERMIIEQASNQMRDMAIYGTNYFSRLPSDMQDITGARTGKIKEAEEKTKYLRYVYYSVIIALILLLAYLNYRKRKK